MALKPMGSSTTKSKPAPKKAPATQNRKVAQSARNVAAVSRINVLPPAKMSSAMAGPAVGFPMLQQRIAAAPGAHHAMANRMKGMLYATGLKKETYNPGVSQSGQRRKYRLTP